MLLIHRSVRNIGSLTLYVRRKEAEFTFHAQKRMAERYITEEQIANVLEKPDTEKQARLKGCRRAERKLGKRTLGVIYQEKRKTIKIITVW